MYLLYILISIIFNNFTKCLCIYDTRYRKIKN